MNMIRRIMNKEEQLHLAALIKAERRQKLNELGHMIRGTTEKYSSPKDASKTIVNMIRGNGYS